MKEIWQFISSFGVICFLLCVIFRSNLERWIHRRANRTAQWKSMKVTVDKLNRLLDEIERDTMSHGSKEETKT
jgi:uncharacterized membrane protein YhiD involved in acid resistance